MDCTRALYKGIVQYHPLGFCDTEEELASLWDLFYSTCDWQNGVLTPGWPDVVFDPWP